MKKNFGNIYKSTCFLQIAKIIMIAMVILAISFSCKKEAEVEPVEELPVFGTCKAVPANGGLSQSATNGVITYLTSGGGKIVIDRFTITISHKDYPGFDIQSWGNSHENLNGKHVKDWEGKRRSLVFPDGTKITMISNDSKGVIQSATIYDGQQCHHFNTSCDTPYNTLEYSSANSAFTKRLDDAEADGETGTFEITQTGLLFYNIYTETIPGQKVEKRVPIGELDKDDPHRVDDLYN